MRNAYHRRRDLAVSLLKDLGRYVYTPHGAFYALIDVTSPNGTRRDGRQFAFDLLRARNAAVAPGSRFGEVADQHVRISLAASEEEIERGVREICKFTKDQVSAPGDGRSGLLAPSLPVTHPPAGQSSALFFPL